jgi:hypothetical protein
MRQALHIFAKDVRCLWYEIAIVLIIAVDYAYLQCLSHPPYVLATVLLALQPIAWPFLVVRAVHEEPLPGDQQFWITRPYSWRSLLAAKVLFMLAFLHLPLFLADCVILAWHGFSPLPYLPGLLWRQAAFLRR